MRWYDDERVLRVLDEGELLHVAIATRGGPRVTPTAFSVDRHRLWFVVARSSVKARVIAQRPLIGALVRAGDRALVMNGRASLIDPLTARGVMSVDRLVTCRSPPPDTWVGTLVTPAGSSVDAPCPPCPFRAWQ